MNAACLFVEITLLYRVLPFSPLIPVPSLSAHSNLLVTTMTVDLFVLFLSIKEVLTLRIHPVERIKTECADVLMSDKPLVAFCIYLLGNLCIELSYVYFSCTVSLTNLLLVWGTCSNKCSLILLHVYIFFR